MEADLAGRRALLRLPCFDDHDVDDDNDHILMMTMIILTMTMATMLTLRDEALWRGCHGGRGGRKGKRRGESFDVDPTEIKFSFNSKLI